MFIGVGVFAKVDIPKRKFLMEYPGESLDVANAAEREDYYDENSGGSFMFLFQIKMW